MAPTLGFALLLLVFSINVFIPLYTLITLNGKTNLHKRIFFELQKISQTLCYISLLASISSQVCLIYSFIISDYSVLNVYKNSHHLKPLIYKISGSWGNHEGSMLLLLSVICAYTCAFNFFSKIDEGKKIIINSLQSIIIALFAAFTAFTSNPFEKVFPTPEAGLGLNPILQDIGLALHPPMLYTGYLGFSLVFSFAIAGLLSENIDEKFAKMLKPWLFFAWGCLTLGIGLGAWWAYRELGWGGYWFWDPVENVSLMPWLSATALIHAARTLEKKNIFQNWTIYLALQTFILCLIGIFLVRSGILTSVHSFAVDAKRGFFVIFLILFLGGGSLLLFGAKMNWIDNSEQKISFLTKIGAILINNYFLVIALFIVLLGTLYPIFLRGFFDQFISIGPNYYNKIFSILIIPFLIFLGISYNLNYQEPASKNFFFSSKNLVILLASVSLSASLFIFNHETKFDFLAALILCLAFFALLMAIFNHKNIKNLPATFAHCGFVVMILGIIINSTFGMVKEINLKQTEIANIKDFSLKFNDIEYYAGKNFFIRQGNFTLFKNEKMISQLKPQLRYYPVSEQTTHEASIKHRLAYDFYLVIGTKDENENYALRIYYKPFIYLIWLGCLMICSAAFLRIFR